GKEVSRCNNIFDQNAMNEILKLFDDNKVSFVDKIVLGSTFDNVVVEKQDFDKLINAFEKFEGDTNLKEQAGIIKKMMEDDNCIAVAWNQTGISGNTWDNYSYNEKTDESEPYNLFKQNDHWFLFDEIKA